MNEIPHEPIPEYRHADTFSSPPYSEHQARLRYQLSLLQMPIERKRELHAMLGDFSSQTSNAGNERHQQWAYQQTINAMRQQHYEFRPEVDALENYPGTVEEARKRLTDRLASIDPLIQALETYQLPHAEQLRRDYGLILKEALELSSIDEYVVVDRAIDHLRQAVRT